MITKYNKFFEYRNQLEIPFGDKHPLHGKPLHVHLQDALLEIGKPFNIDDYNTNQDFWSNFNDKKNMILASDIFTENMSDNDMDYVQLSFLEHYPIDDNNNKKFYKLSKEDFYEKYGSMVDLSENEDIRQECLTDEGKEVFDDYIRHIYIPEKIEESNIENELDIDDYGLLELYRVIRFEKESHNDVYENIIKYWNLGIYWSYDKNVAEAHNGGMGGEDWLLTAKVRPECVNYPNTIYKTIYSLREECEIELIDNSPILLTTLEPLTASGISLKLDNPILIKA